MYLISEEDDDSFRTMMRSEGDGHGTKSEMPRRREYRTMNGCDRILRQDSLEADNEARLVRLRQYGDEVWQSFE